MSKDFDFTQYLSEDQIKGIAERVCEKQFTDYITQGLINRNFGGGTTVDQILAATAKIYTEKLGSKFEDDFLKICKEEISREVPLSDNETVFRSTLNYALENAGKKYIESNLELIQAEMKDEIHKQARLLSANMFSAMIAQMIDVQAIVKRIAMDAKSTAE